MDMTENNKNIKILKDELQTRRISIEAKIVIIRKNQAVEKTTLLEEIRKNQIREQKVQKKLEKDKGQAWKDDRMVYIKGRIYITNNRKI